MISHSFANEDSCTHSIHLSKQGSSGAFFYKTLRPSQFVPLKVEKHINNSSVSLLFFDQDALIEYFQSLKKIVSLLKPTLIFL